MEPFVCESCKTTVAVTWGADPYAAEIHEDFTPVWKCENCRYESAMDI